MKNSNTHTQETKMISLKGFNSVTQLIEDKQNEIRSIFALHKAVLSIYKTDNLAKFRGIELIVQDSKINPIFKEMVKGVNPFKMLYGTFSLSRIINTIGKEDFLGLMKPYNTSVLTYANASIVERQSIINRGTEISEIFSNLQMGLITPLEFSYQLLAYFPELPKSIKAGKISTNVAEWLYVNCFDAYEALNVANAYNVEVENVRNDVKKVKGLDGLIRFDTLINEGFSLLSASAEIGYKLTIKVSSQAEKLALAKANAKGETVAKAKKADDKKADKESKAPAKVRGDKTTVTATLEALAQ